jgi:hypothetical protein
MKSMELPVKRFIAEPISVNFNNKPLLIKKPPCPDSFTWQNETFPVKACLAEWKDYSRLGRMAKNMQPQHAKPAGQKGSWGVGKFFFDLEVDDGRLFRIYYDRAPKNAHHRKGEWMLLAELENQPNSQ